MKPKVLIIDDDEEIRTQMKWAVAGEYDVALAGDRQIFDPAGAALCPHRLWIELHEL